MTYTYDMTKFAIVAAIAAMALALLLPMSVHAKAKGDTIGASTKPVLTGTSRADMADAITPTAFYYEASTTATSTAKSTGTAKATAKPSVSSYDEQRIELLKQQIALLQQLIKLLSK